MRRALIGSGELHRQQQFKFPAKLHSGSSRLHASLLGRFADYRCVASTCWPGHLQAARYPVLMHGADRKTHSNRNLTRPHTCAWNSLDFLSETLSGRAPATLPMCPLQMGQALLSCYRCRCIMISSQPRADSWSLLRSLKRQSKPKTNVLSLPPPSNPYVLLIKFSSADLPKLSHPSRGTLERGPTRRKPKLHLPTACSHPAPLVY